MPEVLRNLLCLSAANTESMNLVLVSYKGANFDGGESGCSLDAKIRRTRNVTPDKIMIRRLNFYFGVKLLESVDWGNEEGWDDVA
jgi:hypothetical protein